MQPISRLHHHGGNDSEDESQNGIRCKPLAGCFVCGSHHSRCIAGGRGTVLHEMPKSGQIVCRIEP